MDNSNQKCSNASTDHTSEMIQCDSQCFRPDEENDHLIELSSERLNLNCGTFVFKQLTFLLFFD